MLLKILLFSLALVVSQTPAPSKDQLNEQLFEAVRKGDAAAVTAALDRGADVNAKFRYGTTALFKAAERGNADVAKVLIDRGVDVKVRDTFYQATAMTWALDGNHVNVVRLILEKNGDAVEDVLMAGVRGGNEEYVKMALDRGGAKPQTLTVAWVISSSDAKTANIAEMLKKAGATPPIEVDAATLQSYAGKYKGEPGPEFTIVAKEGILFANGLGRGELRLMPLDKTTFRPLAFNVTLTFNVDAGKVTGIAFKQGQNTTQMKRLE
ncbi:MAG TPA: ankyrin repeat domain-containing protein [Pyrinomonadaceae bacterium]|nr:ankyrin repeat domain-containing protein [Pyrinomonadaceae bacterium]